MKAFAIRKYGDPLRPVDVPEPVVGARDVLVRVDATAVNSLDEKIRTGSFRQVLPYDLPLVLGHDVAGTVLAVGPQVQGFAVGDEVFGRPRAERIGTFVERIAVHEDDLALKPTSISLPEAASLPLVALTAWQALVERGGVGAGQKVLVHSGAGGVGSIAIQLAKHLGATVATTAGGSNADFVRDLGADVVVDHRTEDFGELLSGYDLVLDGVGGKNVETSLRVLRRGGRVIGIAGPPDPAFARATGANPLLRLAVTALSAGVRRRARALGVGYEFLFMRASGDQLREIARLVDEGAVRPVVGRVVPFAEIPQALAALGRGGLRGKVVATGA